MIGERSDLIIIHRMFWPQNFPYAQMLKHISLAARKELEKIEVLTTHIDNAEKTIRSDWSEGSRVKVTSMKLGSGRGVAAVRKLLDTIQFSLWVFVQLMLKRPNVVMIATTPPVIMAVVVRWAAWAGRFRYIYHCQDIHPEAMRLNGNLNNGWLYKQLLALDLKNINYAHHVIVLSENMRKTLIDRGCRHDHIKVINNFVYERGLGGKDKHLFDKVNPVSFLFAGTIGHFQNLDILLEAIFLLKNRTDIEFLFMGDGICRNSLEGRAQSMGLDNVYFVGQKPVEEAVLAMASADYGIVSIAPKISGVAYPSKTMMYLSNGLPIFAIVDEETDIYDMIHNESLGVAVHPESSSAIAVAIKKAVWLCQTDKLSRSKIVQFCDSNFSQEIILCKFIEVFVKCQ